MSIVKDYFTELSDRFGNGWNEFWYRPSDPFTLSVIRILTGVAALFMHVTLAPDIVQFFAAGGWFTPERVAQLSDGHSPSYLYWFSSPREITVVHWAGIVVLALFTLGFFTRITSILSLVIVVATINRAPMLTSQFEPVVALLLLYLCIGPSGAYMSIDAWLRRRRRAAAHVAIVDDPRSTWATLATRLMQVHVAMLYGLMGLSKLMATQWWDGTGVWWLIARPDSRLVDLTWLHTHPMAVNLWNHAIVVFEISFAILIWNRLARPLLLAIAFVIWPLTGLLTSNIPFGLIMLVANLAFFSPELLRQWLSRKAAPRPEPAREAVRAA